jgi:hypothetical protein
MSHLSEEQLILHYYGEDAADPSVERHLHECSGCRGDYSALQLVLNSVDSVPVPDRSGEYGAQVWRRVQPKLGRRRRWRSLFQQRIWILVPSTALLMLLAFFAGRFTQSPGKGPTSAANVRERVLLVAVGDHLDRSQMVLAELSNAPDGKGQIDISGERQIAQDLLDDNRLYRQTARSTGDTAVASVLDDLERVLLEVANSPSEVSPEQFDQLRQEIRDRGLVFKVRIVGSQVRQRENAPVQTGSKDSKNL